MPQPSAPPPISQQPDPPLPLKAELGLEATARRTQDGKIFLRLHNPNRVHLQIQRLTFPGAGSIAASFYLLPDQTYDYPWPASAYPAESPAEPHFGLTAKTDQGVIQVARVPWENHL